jgi:tetratricopeptide (TPR) repeat protein
MSSKQILLPKKEIATVFDLFHNGYFQKTIDSLQELNLRYPKQPLLFNLAGICFKELGDLEAAVKMLNICISLNPNYAEAYYNLAVIQQSQKDNEIAIKNYKKAISISPNYPDAYNNLGNLFLEKGKFKESIEALGWAIAYKGNFAEAHNNLGNTLNAFGRVDDAIVSFKKAISYQPDYANAFFNLALAFKDIGNKEEFIFNINRVIELKPSWGAAYFHLSQVIKFKKNDIKLNQMEALLAEENLNEVDRTNLNFALAKAYEDIGEINSQFKALNKGNYLRKKALNYNISRDQKLFSRIREAFNPVPEILDNSTDNSSKTPIFIIGMPRSGTSLAHQILDSHNQVKGAGELNFLNKAVFPIIKENNNLNKSGLTTENLISIRQNYLDSISELDIKEKFVVDKMPLNFRYTGFILSAIPEAKVIHTKRNPIATCWSIYKYFFNGNAYSFNQEDLATYFQLYSGIMKLWARLFPDKIYDLNYENLTANQKAETKKILKFCNLEWDENCLNFHQSKTPVKTTSSMQVRQKMYKGSSEAWKKYEDHLQQLIKGLGTY